jgi:hypothetical protein
MSTDPAATRCLEELRWPQGVVCVHCGGFDDAIAPVKVTRKPPKPVK